MHYVTIQVDVTDAAALAKYRERGAEPVIKHGGKMIAGGAASEVLEDTGAGAPATVLLAFPDAQSIKNWFEDPEYQELYDLRRQGGKTVITHLPPSA